MCANYKNINWLLTKEKIKITQNEILLAHKKNDIGKILRLQNKLIRSFSARAVAVRKVLENKGSKSPGIDGLLYKTDRQKMDLIKQCKNLKHYKCQAIKRVYIPKPKGGSRPLGLPTIFDRVIQTLYLMALDPIVHEINCQHNYGFIKNKGVRDAATYLWLNLASMHNKNRFIYCVDVEKFFNTVSHEWLIQNVPMDKGKLKQFLQAEVLFLDKFSETVEGFPQGSPISPALANFTLAGLEKTLSDYIIVRYADDFVILFNNEKQLDSIKQTLNEFLKVRGLKINEQKSAVVSVKQGFEFLGLFFREYPDSTRVKGTKQGIFLIKPAKHKIQSFLKNLTQLVKFHKHSKTLKPLLVKLNQKLRGFGQHYRHYTSKKTYTYIGFKLFYILFAMLTRKHRKLGRRKIYEKHFTKIGKRQHIFCYKVKGKVKLSLFLIDKVPIKRHSLSKNFNPYSLENQDANDKEIRKISKNSILSTNTKTNLLRKQNGQCPVCGDDLLTNEELHVHHINPKRLGGVHKYRNLKLLHKTCHQQIEYTTDKNLKAAFKEKGLIETK